VVWVSAMAKPSDDSELRRKQKSKNLAVLAVLVAFVVLVYLVSLVRMGGA
jgi:hypothetical protein